MSKDGATYALDELCLILIENLKSIQDCQGKEALSEIIKEISCLCLSVSWIEKLITM